jgi:hypothetical protein
MTLLASGISLYCFAQDAGAAPANTTLSQSCSTLPDDQKNFAMQLKKIDNQKTFCATFSDSQRQNAMQMMGKPSANGMNMSADDAVENVAKSIPMAPSSGSSTQQTPSGQQSPAQQTKRGGCPVRTPSQ